MKPSIVHDVESVGPLEGSGHNDPRRDLDEYPERCDWTNDWKFNSVIVNLLMTGWLTLLFVLCLLSFFFVHSSVIMTNLRFVDKLNM